MNNSSDYAPPAYNPSGYVPPAYIPLGQTDETVDEATSKDANATQKHSCDGPEKWSSGICACFDDIPSCSVGLLCPCYLFAKNAEFLGSGTFIGSCATHFVLWSLINMFCCVLSDGLIVCLPGCFVTSYACGYRRTLRLQYNLPEAPCGDFITHFCCHLCAICQEYREIRERSGGSGSLDLIQTAVPPVQRMESSSRK